MINFHTVPYVSCLVTLSPSRQEPGVVVRLLSLTFFTNMVLATMTCMCCVECTCVAVCKIKCTSKGQSKCLFYCLPPTALRQDPSKPEAHSLAVLAKEQDPVIYLCTPLSGCWVFYRQRQMRFVDCWRVKLRCSRMQSDDHSSPVSHLPRSCLTF